MNPERKTGANSLNKGRIGRKFIDLSIENKLNRELIEPESNLQKSSFDVHPKRILINDSAANFGRISSIRAFHS